MSEILPPPTPKSNPSTGHAKPAIPVPNAAPSTALAAPGTHKRGARLHPNAPPVPNAPDWYRDAVIYQLHVKSFFDANNDGIGDFAGLLQKLDYIQELGVNTIWLLPFYPSPLRDDGYDIAAYRDVHPDYGTLRDARHFIKEAHARGLRVVTELVINHTSDQHPWFQRARHAKAGSVHRNFYVWSDTDQRYPETRIIFIDTEKSNWTWDPVAGAYFWHRFYSHQPDLNFDNPHVVDAVLNVMRFWLDLGVDGLRLDAVPYLVEREGTNNENLPETHAILRKLRAELDKHYTGRMLLAEANQWPEDTQEYFGQGDECHMAFNFPLMPRMYMAIAQEDRFPITDILRQIPDIPEGCQWAIFLRNHDELTLEMVTAQERDYLWSTYAADRRARLNLGIRRRLAPLLEHDYRRIQLMNGLLLSMPGTPVIYYGDEIGMGDNIFLRDRDGVRTPMQWTPDRNGGFSKADPAGLVLPPLQDALYGFQSVNVEAQARDPHSMLNWMRRTLAVRKRSQAFGRGSMTLLYPGNRKILAYLRQEGDDTILCVFNLSRAAQAVELDLSAMAGKVPVEMLGGTAFPPLGTLPYLLTLPPYAFYWFMLAGEQALPAWHTPAPVALPELRTLVLTANVNRLLEPSMRAELEAQELRQYLPRRRWFPSKGETLRQTRLEAIVTLPGTENHVVMAEVVAEFDKHTERYCLPLAGIEELPGATSPLPGQLALARLRKGKRVGFLTDAYAADEFPKGVEAALRAGLELPTAQGPIRFHATSRLQETHWPEDAPIRRLSAEQSNSSIVIGDQAVLKIIRHVAPGIHPEVEMTRHLTEVGFGNTTALLGHAEREGPDGAPNVLLIMQAFVRNQGDGWGWTLDWLERSLGEVAVADLGAHEHFAGYLSFASALGTRLAELHAALALPSENPDFAPEPATAADTKGWAADILAGLEHALALLQARATQLPEEARSILAALTARAPALRKAIPRLAEQGLGALRTRVHGDFHLGQVLVTQGDAVLVDFEGEPARSLAERRAKTTPLKDVAGLLRSFDYAAEAAASNKAGVIRAAADGAPEERLSSALRDWREAAEAAFMEGYTLAAAAAPKSWLPADWAPVLDLFLLEKALYEVGYEIANRPAWLHVPLRGLDVLTQRLTA